MCWCWYSKEKLIVSCIVCKWHLLYIYLYNILYKVHVFGIRILKSAI